MTGNPGDCVTGSTNRWQMLQRLGDCICRVLIVNQVAGQILVVRRHIEETVTTQIEDDDPLFAFGFGIQGFVNRGDDGVG